MLRTGARRRLAHSALVAAALTPLLMLVVGAATDGLGANPVEKIAHETGKWTLRLLVLTLCVTPARRVFGWPALAPFRRTLGLLTFAWASLHFATYAVLDLGLELAAVAEDLRERPYIQVGFAAFVLLLPLAATSTRGAIRRLGRRWVKLHRLVYLAAIGGAVHFLWLAKADLREPLVYAAIVTALLGVRLLWAWRRSRTGRPTGATAAAAMGP